MDMLTDKKKLTELRWECEQIYKPSPSIKPAYLAWFVPIGIVGVCWGQLEFLIGQNMHVIGR